jgi:capsular polysaccharide biosynthesis protein
MEFPSFIKLISKKQGTILTIVFAVIILTIGASLLMPLKYSAKSRLLVMQNAGAADVYTLSKSNEYLGNLFAQVVYSGSFYDSVLSSQYDIDKNYFAGSYSDQLKAWQKMVETKTLSDTGIIRINVYHTNPYQAQQISLAINDILINKNTEYQGGGQLVKVRAIDQTLISSYPVKPNLPQNAVLALAIGLLFSLVYIYLYPEEKHDIKLWSKRKSHKSKRSVHSIKIDYSLDDLVTEKKADAENITYVNNVEENNTDETITNENIDSENIAFDDQQIKGDIDNLRVHKLV